MQVAALARGMCSVASLATSVGSVLSAAGPSCTQSWQGLGWGQSVWMGLCPLDPPFLLEVRSQQESRCFNRVV